MATDTSPSPTAPEPAPQREAPGQLRSRLDKVIDSAAKIIAWLVFIAMAISVVEVVSRYGFNSPTSWVHEMVIFLISILFALGGATALARDRHIRVRIIYDAVSPEWRRWLDVLNGFLTVVFTFGMTYAAYTMFYRSIDDPLGGWTLERSGTSWDPPFPSFTKGIILFALALMAVQSILHLIRALRGNPSNKSQDLAREGR